MLLLHHLGPTWLFGPITANSPLEQISADKGDDAFKFAALVVQLACVEIRLILDELTEEYEKQESRSNKRHEFMLSACYTILEKSIEYLSQKY